MKKTVILDCDGVVFEPVKEKVAKAIVEKYGFIKGTFLNACYRMGVAKKFVANNVAQIVYECALGAQPLPGALGALKEMSNIQGVKVYVCTNIVYPGWRTRLEQEYCSRYPEMANVRKIDMISPMESKRNYVLEATSKAHSSNRSVYIVESNPENLKLVNPRRVNPVLISTNSDDINRAARESFAESFSSLVWFNEYLKQR